MTRFADVAQSLVVLVLLAGTVLMWLRLRTTMRELRELRTSEENRVKQSGDLAALTASCVSRIDVLHAKAVKSEAESHSWRTTLEQDRLADADTARRHADTALVQVHQALIDVRGSLSKAVSRAAVAREDDLLALAKTDQITGGLADRLRDLEGRMGDFLHGCDELVRAEIAGQLAEALPMLTDAAET